MDNIDFKNYFESELNLQLFYRTESNMSKAERLFKAFQYYDLNNSYSVDLYGWIKSINRIGVNNFNDIELEKLFNIYKGNNNRLNYINFIGNFCEHKAYKSKNFCDSNYDIINNDDNSNEIIKNNSLNDFNHNKISYNELVLHIKEKLIKCGITSIFSLYFYILKNDIFSKFITYYDLIYINKVLKLDIDEDLIFKVFSNENNYKLNYLHLISNVIGKINKKRINVIKNVYNKIKKKYNKITFKLLKDIYLEENHYDFINLIKNADLIKYEYENTFEEYHKFYYYIKNHKNMNINTFIDYDRTEISLDEFIGYYQNISMYINDDKIFSDIVNNVYLI